MSKDQVAGDSNDKLSKIIHDMPKLHYWGGKWQTGGLNRTILERLHELIFSSGNDDEKKYLLETGAGLSTLVMLAGQPEKLITIAPDKVLMGRISDQIQYYGLDQSRHESHVCLSEDILPALAGTGDPYLDFALIDGGHGYPTVFVDFCYINKMLKNGGLLAIDDVQLHSVRELYNLLRGQPDYDLYLDMGKLVVFRKVTSVGHFPDFGLEPYLAGKADTPYSLGSFFRKYLLLRKRI